jgi:enoyl-CoA hydratase
LLVEETREGRVLILTLNRPEALNAIDVAVLDALDKALTAALADDTVGAIVLTGAGQKAFVAGADITQFPSLDVFSAGTFVGRAHQLFLRLEEAPKAVITAVNGYCLGGGLELALATDIRLAAEGARFGQPEVNLGLIPGWGGTQRLPRLVGPGWARQLILSGEMIDAETALRIGLVNEVLPAASLLPRAVALGATIASRAPTAVALAKAAMRRGMDVSLPSGLAYETAMWQIVFATADAREGVAAFLEKRTPQFTGR